MFKNMKKIKDNFDAETIDLKINKCINAKLLKFNIFLYSFFYSNKFNVPSKKKIFTLEAHFTTNKYYTHKTHY